MLKDFTQKEKKRFSFIARLRSTNHAVRGLRVFFVTQHNAWVHLFVALLVVVLGVLLRISHIEWLSLIVAISLVLIAEMINTAFEIDIDLTSPEYHPYAKDTKDVAAGFVLLSVVFALIIGGIIFIPKLLPLI